MTTSNNATSRIVQAATDALSDGMVERLATTSGNALEVLDRLNDEDTKDAVLHALERLSEVHRSGALDTLFDLLGLVHGARSAMTDTMVERLVVWVETMITNVANEGLAEFAGETVDAMQEAALEAGRAKPGGGIISTIAMLKKPETQQAIQFLMAFAGKMQDNAVSSARCASTP